VLREKLLLWISHIFALEKSGVGLQSQTQSGSS
jgi:hypothetical protein